MPCKPSACLILMIIILRHLLGWSIHLPLVQYFPPVDEDEFIDKNPRIFCWPGVTTFSIQEKGINHLALLLVNIPFHVDNHGMTTSAEETKTCHAVCLCQGNGRSKMISYYWVDLNSRYKAPEITNINNRRVARQGNQHLTCASSVSPSTKMTPLMSWLHKEYSWTSSCRQLMMMTSCRLVLLWMRMPQVWKRVC